MADYVYAIIYDSTGNFAAFTKCASGYFFSNGSGGGSIVTAGQPLRGGGKFAFPGGALNTNEDTTAGAIREFHEETNYDLTNNYTDTFFEEYLTASATYYGVYFKVASLSTIISTISANLLQGSQAMADVQSGKITAYADIFTTYPNSPPDNELATVASWNLVNDKTKIQALNDDTDTDWFYDILDYLYDREFHTS